MKKRRTIWKYKILVEPWCNIVSCNHCMCRGIALAGNGNNVMDYWNYWAHSMEYTGALHGSPLNTHWILVRFA